MEDDVEAFDRGNAEPLEHLHGEAFAELLRPGRSTDELRALAFQLMQCGPPMRWLGALLLVHSNRISNGDGPRARA